MLKDTLNHIKDIATSIPNIELIHIGDVYYLNEQQHVNYPAIVIQSQYNRLDVLHKRLISTVNIFVVDRETEDKSNKLDIQDWAISALYTIINKLSKNYIIDGNITTNTFEERFGSICAGAYATINITTNISECNKYGLGPQ